MISGDSAGDSVVASAVIVLSRLFVVARYGKGRNLAIAWREYKVLFAVAALARAVLKLHFHNFQELAASVARGICRTWRHTAFDHIGH